MGIRFPYRSPVYDETIDVLKTAVHHAKLGDEEKLAAIRRLDAQARMLERTAGAPTFDEHVGDERRRSAEYGGASVMTPPRRHACQPTTARGTAGQLPRSVRPLPMRTRSDIPKLARALEIR